MHVSLYLDDMLAQLMFYSALISLAFMYVCICLHTYVHTFYYATCVHIFCVEKKSKTYI